VLVEDGELGVVEVGEVGEVDGHVDGEDASGEVDVVDEQFVVFEQGDQFLVEVDCVDEEFQVSEFGDVVDDVVSDLGLVLSERGIGYLLDDVEERGFV
jgi:hypothetical protein